MTDEKIILALLSNPTIAEAAKGLGIKPQTIYNKLRDEAFRARYAEARRFLLECESHRLQIYLSDSIETMHDIAMNSEAAYQVRINACDALMRHCYRLTEITDIMIRLEKLEKIMEAEHDR